jgi:molybdopterin synthase sulfur carrier subunit
MASAKPPTGHFTLLYFAAASTYTRKASEPIQAPLRVSSLFDKLEEMYPGIRAKVLGSCAVTVNLEYIDLDEAVGAEPVVIREGDEVAIIPPVSSG